MNREFFINVVFLVAVNLLIKSFYLFGIDRTVQNTVESGAYGLYFALFNLTYLFQMVNDLGVQYFNNRNVSWHRHSLDRYFPNILILKAVLALLYFTCVCFFAYLSGYTPAVLPLLLLLGANQVLISLIFFLRSNISGLGLYRTDSLFSALDRLIVILICGILLWVEPFRSRFRIEWFVLAQTAALGFTAIAAFAVVRGRLTALRFGWQPEFLWSILKKSYPYALIVFLMTVYTRIDGVMIERLLPGGAAEAGRYASAYRLLDAAGVIGNLFAGLLFPMFARLHKEQQAPAALAGFSFSLIWAGAVTLTASTFFFREEIMAALYVQGDAYSAKILGFLMLSYLAVCGGYIHGTLLGACGKLRALNLISLGGVGLNVLLNLWLIPRYQAVGAAVATCFTQYTVWAGQYAVARRAFHLTPTYKSALRLLAYTAGVALLVGYPIREAPLPWTAKLALSLCAGLLLAVLFQFIDLKKLGLMLREGSAGKYPS